MSRTHSQNTESLCRNTLSLKSTLKVLVSNTNTPLSLLPPPFISFPV